MGFKYTNSWYNFWKCNQSRTRTNKYIPRGYSVRLYPRSSLALKQGLTLANNVGIIDWDYVEPVFAMIVNISGDVKYVNNNERICQGELFKDVKCILDEIDEKPDRKTDRDGGFGSTGKE